MAPMDEVSCVVELGAGTGPYTREILPRLSPRARLVSFEIDPALADALARDLPDPRLKVVADSAVNLEAHLGGQRPEVIVSAIPFTSLPPTVRQEILAAARRVLADDGVLLVLQYSPFMQRTLQESFGSVTRRLSLRNVPPAVLFACRGAKAAS